MKPKYKTILLKLSGEQLAGKYESGIDPEIAGWLAEEAKLAADKGVRIVIMVGGGNFVRGAQIAGHGIKRVTADHMGMLATMMNALALTDIFESKGVPTRCLSSIFAEQVAEPFVHRLASKHLDSGRVVIVAGGTGRPYITTDTAAVLLALELGCEVVMKATKVDGVYDKDPVVHSGAKKLPIVSYTEALSSPDIKIMDKASIGLAMEHNIPVIIFDATAYNAIFRVLCGEPLGTVVKHIKD
jgi:uridylate kinase